MPGTGSKLRRRIQIEGEVRGWHPGRPVIARALDGQVPEERLPERLAEQLEPLEILRQSLGLTPIGTDEGARPVELGVIGCRARPHGYTPRGPGPVIPSARGTTRAGRGARHSRPSPQALVKVSGGLWTIACSRKQTTAAR